MDSKERIALIAKSKSVRQSKGFYGAFELRILRREFLKFSGNCDHTRDVYPVRAVAILEVFTRGWAARLVDHSPIFAERALPAVHSFKLDYPVLLSIAGELITFGDLVGFAISVNRFEQIISIFSMLCGADVAMALRAVVDAREERFGKNPPSPLIADYDQTVKAIAAMFELRHVICHEAPSSGYLDLSGLELMLTAAVEFATALDEVLVQTMYGKNRPLTQSEMNAAAYEDYKQAQQRLTALLTALRDQFKDEPKRLQELELSQNAWEQYFKAQTDFRYNDRGTIGPLLRATEMTSLTNERQRRLEHYLQKGYL